MFCPSCGRDIPDGASFCQHCGKQVRVEREPGGHHWGLRTFVLLLLGLVTVMAGVLFLKRVGTREPVIESLLRPFSQTLASGRIIVQPGQCYYVRFRVGHASPVSARVVGQFQAAGGYGNDIQAVIAEETEFQNWINGHAARVLYSTPKTTTGSINLPITEPGTFCLAFSNRFSLVSAKTVTADIELRYLVR